MSFKLNKSRLNLRVFAAATCPSTGVEGEVCIISSVPMKNWRMSPNDPSGVPRSEGDVWIRYSLTGNLYNVLKNDALIVATIYAWQYVGGAWVDVEALSYQNNKWSNWIPESVLYSTNVTPTRTVEPTSYMESGSTFTGVTPNFEALSAGLHLKLSAASNTGWTLFSKRLIDLSKYTKMVAVLDRNATSSDFIVYMGVTASKTANYAVVKKVEDTKTTNQQTLTLDLSDVNIAGYPYLSVRTKNSNYSVAVRDWHLE